MSFTITTDVFCDECSDWVHGLCSHTPKRAKAWKEAKSVGWQKVRGKMLCPRCVLKQLQKPTETKDRGAE